MSVKMFGESVAFTTFGNTKIVLNGSNSTVLATEKMKWNGVADNTSDSYYYHNGYGYRAYTDDSQTIKVKAKMDFAAFESATSIPMPISSEADTKQLTESDFKNAKVSTSGGTPTITLSLSQARLQELMGSLADNTTGMFGGDETGSAPVFSNVSFVIVIGSNGYVKSTKLKCTATISAEMPNPNNNGSTVKTNISMDMAVSMTYNNPGQSVTITAPSDLAAYEEASNLEIGV